MTMQAISGTSVPAPDGCDWCGGPIPDAMLRGSDSAQAVCSQACHEWRKRARGRSVSYGAGGPHPYVAPADPGCWPGWEERRTASREQRRSASLAAARARAGTPAAPDGPRVFSGTGGAVPGVAQAPRAVPAPRDGASGAGQARHTREGAKP
jgi:hypothetical protein